MVSAMEVSADVHLSYLIKAIKEQDPSIRVFGLAGSYSKACGVEVTADITSKGTIGFIEPLKHLPALLYQLYQAKKLLEKEHPDLLIVVDGQGFNVPLAAHAKKLGIKVIYYIPPQEWQWGTEKGGRSVLQVVDQIIAIFKEEADFYNKLGGKAFFNGHPLLDIVQPKLSKTEFCEQHQLSVDKPIVGLFPGSRRQELKYLLPVMIKAIDIVKADDQNVQFILSAATPDCYKRITSKVGDLKVVQGQNYDIMAHSDFIVTATGTATLEAACLQKPMIALYKFSPISYWLIKKLVGHRIPKYAALPNIWLDKMAVPEFVQVGVEPQNVADNILKLLNNPKLREEMSVALQGLNKVMGSKGSLKKNAEIVLKLLSAR